MPPLAYRNGQFLPVDQASIPLHDAGFVWGAVATDAVRTFRHELFRWPAHLARFRQTCRLTEIPLLLSDAELTAAAQELVHRNSALLPADVELMLILLATPGPIPRLLGLPDGPVDPTLLLYTYPLDRSRLESQRTNGVVLRTTRVQAPSWATLPPQAKHRSRLHWWLAEREVQAREAEATALMLDAEGFVTETWNANVLLVQEGHLSTPPRRTVLPGVTLEVVAELCRSAGLPLTERPWHSVDLGLVEEAIVSGTSFCLAPVRRLEGRSLPCPGPVYQSLRQLWEQRLGPW
jgi:branched-subunit amino acid aminotransferase/4-amino-4-deoxychorismate lyase